MESELPDTNEKPGPRAMKSKYEFVMAAAKEAERLNEQLRQTGANPPEKVTIEAIRRIRKGLSRVEYQEPQSGPEEPPKESTFFFGS